MKHRRDLRSPQSILQRLSNRRLQGQSVQNPRTLFILERVLARVAASPYHDRMVLKGGILLYLMTRTWNRPTEDLSRPSGEEGHRLPFGKGGDFAPSPGLDTPHTLLEPKGLHSRRRRNLQTFSQAHRKQNSLVGRQRQRNCQDPVHDIPHECKVVPGGGTGKVVSRAIATDHAWTLGTLIRSEGTF